MIIADTDVLIDYLAGTGSTADRVALELTTPSLRTTVVTRFELLSGATRPRQQVAIEDLLAAVPALPLDDAAADIAATVRRSLAARGESIGMGDSLIAGIVLSNDGILLTRNVNHFKRVDDLRLARL